MRVCGTSAKLSLVNSSMEINEISFQKKKLQTSLCLLDGIYCHVDIQNPIQYCFGFLF